MMGTDGKSVLEIFIWEPGHEEKWDITGFQSQDFFKQESPIYCDISCVLLEKKSRYILNIRRSNFPSLPDDCPDDTIRY